MKIRGALAGGRLISTVAAFWIAACFHIYVYCSASISFACFDQTDCTLLRIIHPGGPYAPAMVILDIYRQVKGAVRPSGRTEYNNSRFRKFDVQSTITAGEPRL